MTTLDTAALSPPTAPWPDEACVTIVRVTDLLLRLERAAPRPMTLRPLADIAPANDGTGDVIVFATVFVDAGDGLGPQPFALNEIDLAADCLADDPPFAAAPSCAPQLRAALAQATDAATLLQRSLS